MKWSQIPKLHCDICYIKSRQWVNPTMSQSVYGVTLFIDTSGKRSKMWHGWHSWCNLHGDYSEGVWKERIYRKIWVNNLASYIYIIVKQKLFKNDRKSMQNLINFIDTLVRLFILFLLLLSLFLTDLSTCSHDMRTPPVSDCVVTPVGSLERSLTSHWPPFRL